MHFARVFQVHAELVIDTELLRMRTSLGDEADENPGELSRPSRDATSFLLPAAADATLVLTMHATKQIGPQLRGPWSRELQSVSATCGALNPRTLSATPTA